MRNVQAKKYLGQHFLNNHDIAKGIVNLISSQATFIVEIGPGMGILTQFLIKKDVEIEVVEIDKESVLYLNVNYPQLKNKITTGDFLKLNLQEKYPKNFSLIGNLPYNISSQILFKVFDNRNQIFELVAMLQKEVAERIAAKNSRKRGVLSVFMQAFYTIEYCFTVNEDMFFPPPKVKSGVIKLIRNKRMNIGCDEQLFKQIVKAGFNQRRKTLRNALKAFNLLNSNKINHLLKLRAEQLSVDDFITITLNAR